MTPYTSQVTTQDEALCHLFFHCCFKDGEFKKQEIDNISGKLVTAGLHANMNFKEQVIKYQEYMSSITNEMAYLQYLLDLVKPVNDMALYSWCIELCMCDGELSLQEEQLLDEIAALLKITGNNQQIIKRVMVQRAVVETEKIF